MIFMTYLNMLVLVFYLFDRPAQIIRVHFSIEVKGYDSHSKKKRKRSAYEQLRRLLVFVSNSFFLNIFLHITSLFVKKVESTLI